MAAPLDEEHRQTTGPHREQHHVDGDGDVRVARRVVAGEECGLVLGLDHPPKVPPTWGDLTQTNV